MVPELSKKVKKLKAGSRAGPGSRQFHPSAYTGWVLIHPVTWV